MAETKFIKISATGGYDVDKRLDFLYNLVYDLKNELRESKLLLKNYQDGSDSEKNFENVLSVERAQITQVQVKNENLSEKNKCLREDLRVKEAENTELHKTISSLEEKLADAELKVKAMENGGDADALGEMFIEAKKSRDLIINKANEKAKATEENTKRFVEEFVTEANNQASKIIYNAERQAAEIIADAKNQAEQIRVSSNNLKSVMYTEMLGISSKILEIRETISELNNYTVAKLLDAENVIESADEMLKSGGIPIFETAQEIQPDYPEEPVYITPEPAPAPKPEKKHNAELDKLQAMAEAIGGTETKTKSQKGSISLDDLTKQAEALDKKVSDNPAESIKKSGAGSTGNPENTGNAGNSKSAKKGGMNLADLMKQAQALDN